MFVHINKFLTFFKADWYNLLIAGVIMVSAITVLIGILKPFLFNRIPWKPLRRACLAFSNVALCFGSVALWFAIKHLSFGIYLHSAISVSLFSIVWYWVYENTCLRDLIEKVGKLTLRKVGQLLTKIFNRDDIKEIEKEVILVAEELKSSTKKEIKSATKNVKTDKELKNL